MFDDHIPQQPGGQVPPNLPIGEPEDMFGAIDKTEATPSSNPTGPYANVPGEQIIDQPSALEAGILRPKQITPNPPSPKLETPAPTPQIPRYTVPPTDSTSREQQTQPGLGDYTIKHPTTSRNILILLVVLVVFAILGGGAWFIYARFIATPNEPSLIETTPVVPTIPTTPTSSDTEDITQEDPDANDQPVDPALRDEEILFGQQVDTDQDGLSDILEQELGTDPANWDTDGDELGDAEEVNIWKTDPLNPDSDGDTYSDGSEVKNGYNPAGPGKIFEPPTVSETSSSPSTNTTSGVTTTVSSTN